RIRNGGRKFPFLFKLHPAFQVNRGSRIILPACRFTSDKEFSTWFRSADQRFSWPNARKDDGSMVDLADIPAPGCGAMLFGYAGNLEHGYCGLMHRQQHLGVGLAFATDVLRFCWIFASYGGWQGQEVVVLEPCTTDCWRLERGIQNGSVREIQPGEVFETVISILAVETDSENELRGRLEGGK